VLNQQYKYLNYLRYYRSSIRVSIFNSPQTFEGELEAAVSIEADLVNEVQSLSASVGFVDLYVEASLINEGQEVESDIIHKSLEVSTSIFNTGQYVTGNAIHAALSVSAELVNTSQVLSSSVIHKSFVETSLSNTAQILSSTISNIVKVSVQLTNSSQIANGEMVGVQLEEVYNHLYNWYVLSNPSSPLPVGTRVPTDDEFKILEGNMDSIYGVGHPEWDRTDISNRGRDAGKNMKALTTWDPWSTMTSTGLYGFNMTASGTVNGIAGNVIQIGTVGYMWASTSLGDSAQMRYLWYANNNSNRTVAFSTKKHGMSLRFILDRTLTPAELSAPNGTILSVVQDYNGNEYSMIKIGTQAWSNKSLRATNYRDGSPIPNINGGSTWISLTTGAYCKVQAP